MFSPNDFVRLWADNSSLQRFSRSNLRGVKLSSDSKAFLIKAGLPGDAAPFLCFGPPQKGVLPRLSSEWNLPDTYRRYRVIGSEGSGDDICIDEEGQGKVVHLNHDDNFREVFINTSIPQLAESLLICRTFGEKVRKQRGEGAWLKGNASPELISWYHNELTRIDPDALQEGCFWWYDLENFHK